MTVDFPSAPEADLSKDRSPGWWSWPVILLTLLFFVSIPFVSEKDGVKGEKATDILQSEEETLPSPDWSHLAIFKLQSQLIIAASSASPQQAGELRKELQAIASDVYTTAALAIVVQFADTSEAGGVAAEKIIREAKFGAAEMEFLRTVESALETGVDSGRREEFRRSLGWFADLLPADGTVGTEPAPGSDGIRSKALLVAASMGMFAIGGLFAILVGGVLLVIFLVAVSSRKGVLRFDSSRQPRGIMLECFAIYLGMMGIGEVLSMTILPWASLPCMILAVALALFWPQVRGVAWRDFRVSIGWTRGRGMLTEIGAGLVGYLGMLPIALVGILITLIFLWLLGGVPGAVSGEAGETAADVKASAPVTHPIIGWILLGNIWVKLLCLFLASIFAPLTEETFFRGIFHRYLRGRWAFLPAALIGAFVFAALHPQGWVAVPALTGMGVGFALIREWRDSLIAPMTAHAINNGVIVGLVSLAL